MSAGSRFRRLARATARIATPPLALVAASFAVSGTALASGLPQLDFGNALTTYQVIWGVAIFAILYVLASRTALPTVEAVLDARAKRIASDLDGAKDAKTRADAGAKAAADATAKARADAQAAIAAALETAKSAAATRAVAENERLDKQLKEAEGQIAAARGAAMAALPGVAADTASALVQRLTGVVPDAGKLSGAIAAAMASKG
jgi:F-type H+-transporting ATPase subunit b